MLVQMKEKVINKVNEIKDFVVENKVAVITYSAVIGGTIGYCVYARHDVKKYSELWKKAKEAMDAGLRDYDYGPYKIMEILEPTTLESIGKTVCHEKTCKAFLDLK